MREIDETVQIQELKLLIDRHCAQVGISARNLTISRREDFIADTIIYRLVRDVAYLPAKNILEVPATWWQHFKQRWFPLWALDRWPIQYTTYCAKAQFPDMVIPRDTHLVVYTWHKNVACAS